jgi:hypothetical protein
MGKTSRPKGEKRANRLRTGYLYPRLGVYRGGGYSQQTGDRREREREAAAKAVRP